MLLSLFIFQKCLSDNFKVQSSKFLKLILLIGGNWKINKKKKRRLLIFKGYRASPKPKLQIPKTKDVPARPKQVTKLKKSSQPSILKCSIQRS